MECCSGFGGWDLEDIIISMAAGAPGGTEKPCMDTEAEPSDPGTSAWPVNCVEAKAIMGEKVKDFCCLRQGVVYTGSVL